LPEVHRETLHQHYNRSSLRAVRNKIAGQFFDDAIHDHALVAQWIASPALAMTL
jgi:homoserine trans-succinylase